MATVGAPASPEHAAPARDAGLAAGAEAPTTEPFEVSIGGRPFRCGADFLDDIADQRQHERIARLGRPCWCCTLRSTRSSAIDHARRIFDAARHPKSFVSLDDADHLLDEPADSPMPPA